MSVHQSTGILSIAICLLCACSEPSHKSFKSMEYAVRYVSPIDGAEMQLIPSGTFQMGNATEGTGDPDEYPVHEVYLDAFYMDVYEVTNARYQQFVTATGYPEPPLWHDTKFNRPDSPVVNVGWKDAVAFANWAHKRLPTEAEWEYAARGGFVRNNSPTGDEITHNDANIGGIGGNDIWVKVAPVGSFPPNGHGLFDITGNVWEWCFDEYNANFYLMSPIENPRFGRESAPEIENFRILRGGGWGGNPDEMRVSDRWYHLTSGSTIGFRCVKDVD